MEVSVGIWALFCAVIVGAAARRPARRRAHEGHPADAPVGHLEHLLARDRRRVHFVLMALENGTVAGEYLTGYLIERSLSLDNLFVFALLFTFFAVPETAQRKVLFWGIIGAIVLRAGFIFAGAALLDAFHWMIYVFGALLVFTGDPDGDARQRGDPPRAQPRAEDGAARRPARRTTTTATRSSRASTASGSRRRCSRRSSWSRRSTSCSRSTRSRRSSRSPATRSSSSPPTRSRCWASCRLYFLLAGLHPALLLPQLRARRRSSSGSA